MKATLVLDLEIENDEAVKRLLERMTLSDARILKGNAYDPGQKDFLPKKEFKFSRDFVRHIDVVSGNNYGG